MHARALALDPALQIHEAAHELIAAIGVLRARRITGNSKLSPIEMHFTHARPKVTTLHKQLFRCRLRFGMPVMQAVLSAAHLQVRMASAEPTLGKLLEQQADAMLEKLPRAHDVATSVRSLFCAEQNLREASAARIAQRLGMSFRTLARKLDDEGTSYRALLDDLREHAARHDLKSTVSIADIADRLGFASTQSFHRAFRRWTGMSAATARLQRRKPKAKPNTTASAVGDVVG